MGGWESGVGAGGVRVSPAMANKARKCVIAVTDLSFPAANLRSVRPRKEEQLRRKNVPGRKREIEGRGRGGGGGEGVGWGGWSSACMVEKKPELSGADA